MWRVLLFRSRALFILLPLALGVPPTVLGEGDLVEQQKAIAALKKIGASVTRYDDGAGVPGLSVEIRDLTLPGGGRGARTRRETIDRELRHLRFVPHLRRLALSTTDFDGTGLKHVAGLKGLESLEIHWDSMGLKDLPRLEDLPELKTLTLSGGKIADADVVCLGSLTSVKEITLICPKVTEAGRKQLQVLLPKCRVRRIPEDAHTEAIARGRAEAEEELRTGEASIWTYGTPSFTSFFEFLDRETGLYRCSFGCVIDDELVGRVEGHNARIAEYVRDHGPPKNSFKPWEKELFGLKEYFETRCRTERPIRLNAGGLPTVSADGKYSVKLVMRPDRTLKGLPTESIWIAVGEQDVESRRTPILMKDAELFWGPKGSSFAVLRGQRGSGTNKSYMALDLRDVKTIRWEFGDK
jgi:hypothetical protein